ncbi:putative transposase [Mycobacterium xenopi 3993]|nr:putative transposase [Mycobacterium xenopi 3993]EUA17346.1 putative transposase [Mycobacterium xenopi 3993]
MSIGSVNSLRRNLVTKTKCACSSDTLCRLRRYVVCVSGHLYGCAVGKSYRMAPTPAAAPVRKPRARKRPKGAPTHVRSWPLRPLPTQCREIGIRFFTGVRVYNAVLGEFIARSRAVKSDLAWAAARELPHRSPASVRYGGLPSAPSSRHTVSPSMRLSRSRRRCASRGCVNICRRRRPRVWGAGV